MGVLWNIAVGLRETDPHLIVTGLNMYALHFTPYLCQVGHHIKA